MSKLEEELYLARDPATIARLLHRGANPDWQTAQGETALTFAAHDGAIAAVELLLAGGADPDVPKTAWPPLFYAAMAGHLEVLKALVSMGADMKRTHDGKTALAIAVDHAHWEVAGFLLERAPSIASLGAVDPAGIAHAKGQHAMAERIAAQRWSTPDQGLRGRLLIFGPPSAAESYLVRLEIENVGAAARSVPVAAPLAFTWRLNCDDAEVPTLLARMEVMHQAGWTQIAPGARHQLRVSSQGTAARPHALDLITKIWTALPPGTLHLEATYRLDLSRAPDAPKDARAVTFVLPSCRLPRRA